VKLSDPAASSETKFIINYIEYNIVVDMNTLCCRKISPMLGDLNLIRVRDLNV
jgi:hypothetical protein